MLLTKNLIFNLHRCSSSVINTSLPRCLHLLDCNRISQSKALTHVSESLHDLKSTSFVSRRSSSSSTEPTEAPIDCDPEVLQCLRLSGFAEDACRRIVEKLHPTRLTPSSLNGVMNLWGSFQFGQDRLVYLLTENPELLLAHREQTTSAFVFLSSLFTQNYVYKVLLNCPQVISEKHREITSKLDFLNKTLGVPNSEIVASSSLGHRMQHIRLRYEFLKRCGVYKPVIAGVSSSNPSLSELLDTSDDDFAKKIAKLSPLEYQVFQNLFAMELDDESSDSDSE